MSIASVVMPSNVAPFLFSNNNGPALYQQPALGGQYYSFHRVHSCALMSVSGMAKQLKTSMLPSPISFNSTFMFFRANFFGRSFITVSFYMTLIGLMFALVKHWSGKNHALSRLHVTCPVLLFQLLMMQSCLNEYGLWAWNL